MDNNGKTKFSINVFKFMGLLRMATLEYLS